MNTQIILAFAVVLLSALTHSPLFCSAYSPPVILNTKGKTTKGNDVCSWDQVEIHPTETLNQLGKCRELYCGQDFTITISNCFADPSGKCQWFGTDYAQPYPDCCGIKVCS